MTPLDEFGLFEEKVAHPYVAPSNGFGYGTFGLQQKDLPRFNLCEADCPVFPPRAKGPI